MKPPINADQHQHQQQHTTAAKGDGCKQPHVVSSSRLLPVRPYVSSTFSDLEAEFQHLHMAVFPLLNAMCARFGSYFEAVDRRRTVVDARSTADFVLKHALDNVQRSSPYFMCVLGSHYGAHALATDDAADANSTIQRNLTVAAHHGHAWVAERRFAHCSIVELEIQLAALSRGCSAAKNCCFFYMQDCYRVMLDDCSSDAVGTSWGGVLETEDSFAQERLLRLRNTIIDGGYNVKFFATPEALGKQVYCDWEEVILNHYRYSSDTIVHSGELRYQDLAIGTLTQRLQQNFHKYPALRDVEAQLYGCLHFFSEAYLHSKGKELKVTAGDENFLFGDKLGDGVFSSTQTLIDSIKPPHDTIDDAERIFVLVGDPGSGKSALLSSWMGKFTDVYPSILVISEFVGSSYLSYDVTTLMRRCICTLRERYWKKGCLPSEVLDDLSSFESLSHTFGACLRLVPCIIIVDGLNDIEFGMNEDIGSIKGLKWMPEVIPEMCRFIVTTRRSDLTFKALSARRDVRVHFMPRVDVTERDVILRQHMRDDVLRLLSGEQCAKMWANRLSERPLFISTVAVLLESCKNAREIDQVIDRCSALRTFRDFWKAVFVLLSQRYSWSRHSSGQPGSVRQRSNVVGWVAESLKLIVTSRSGLFRHEILHLMSLLGYRGRATVTPHDWSLFQAAAGGVLRETHDGMVRIAHDDAKLAIGFCLLGVGSYSRSDSKQHRYHAFLASYFLKYGCSERKLTELPWQLLQAKDRPTLCQVICKPRFFLTTCRESRRHPYFHSDHISYWQKLKQHDFNILHCMQHMISQAENPDVADGGGGEQNPGEIGGDDEEVEKNAVWGRKSKVQPTTIIVTQHVDDASTAHKTTDESRSEAGDLISDTDSSFVNFSDLSDSPSPYDLHSIGGWTPADGGGGPECPIDTSPLDRDEVAQLLYETAWLMIQLGPDGKQEFVDDGRQAIAYCRKWLDDHTPLTTRQSLVTFFATDLECECGVELPNNHLLRALNLCDRNTLTTLDLSAASIRDVTAARGRMFMRLATSLMNEGRYDEAHKACVQSFLEMKACGSVSGYAQATRVLGRLLAKQGMASQGEVILQKSLATLVKWHGHAHINVAHSLCALARFFYTAAGKNARSSRRRAMVAYKQALEIFQLNYDVVNCANVIEIIGKLLYAEGTLRSKEEAYECFERAKDLTIVKLKGLANDGASRLSRINKDYKRTGQDLRAGRYAYGLAPEPDHRTPCRPYSALSWQANDLNRLVGDDELSSETVESFSSSEVRSRSPKRLLSTSSNPTTRRPYSSYTARSIGCHVLLTSRKPRFNRRSQSARLNSILAGHAAPRSRHLNNVAATSADNQERFGKTLAPVETPISKSQMWASYDTGSVQAPTDRPETSEGREVPVLIVPAGRNSRLSVKLDLDDWDRASRHMMKDDDQVVPTFYTASEVNTSKKRVQCHSSASPTQSSSFTHRRRCTIPSGPGRLCQTVHGPHSTISDVLDPPDTPRPNVFSSGLHHKTAWYHVPGRYAKPTEVLPPKRSQKRPGSGASVATTYVSCKSEPNLDETDTELVCTSISPSSAPVVRRHSMPHAYQQSTDRLVIVNPSIMEEPIESDEDRIATELPIIDLPVSFASLAQTTQ